MPEAGLSASENGLGHSEHVEQHLLKDAAESGHPMVLPDHVPKTHLAMAMAELARDKGTEVYDAVHDAIFSAHYGEGRDIGSKSVLLAVAEAHGLDAAEVEAAWDDGAYDERLHVFARLALSLGVGTTPSALLCNRLIVGTRPYGVLRQVMRDCAREPGS
ncbi:MAG: hypothetical protein D9V44_10120 [Actinobacteria bacterium]|nr:MAG: hypothetical protein D9V44_10120 [Actinomycetota bacterium]